MVGDEDYLALANTDTQAVTVVAFVSTANLHACLNDFALRARDATGAELAVDDDSWYGQCPMLVVDVPASSTRYLEISASNDASTLGDYTLAVTPL